MADLGGGELAALGGTVATAAAAVWALLKRKDAAVEDLHSSVQELMEALGEASAIVKQQSALCRSSIAMAKMGCNSCPKTDDRVAPNACPMYNVIDHMEDAHALTEEGE